MKLNHSKFQVFTALDRYIKGKTWPVNAEFVTQKSVNQFTKYPGVMQLPALGEVNE
jgi:hypothetical protein